MNFTLTVALATAIGFSAGWALAGLYRLIHGVWTAYVAAMEVWGLELADAELLAVEIKTKVLTDVFERGADDRLPFPPASDEWMEQMFGVNWRRA